MGSPEVVKVPWSQTIQFEAQLCHLVFDIGQFSVFTKLSYKIQQEDGCEGKMK